MGARSNIVVQDGEHRVWLYGHWMACASVEHAAYGLSGDRYDDPQKLAGIISGHMPSVPRGEGWGFGISAVRHDNQYPILVIDSRSRWRPDSNGGRADVWFEDEDGTRISRVFARQEFRAIAGTIPPFAPRGWDEAEHECAFGRFLPEHGPDQIRDS